MAFLNLSVHEFNKTDIIFHKNGTNSSAGTFPLPLTPLKQTELLAWIVVMALLSFIGAFTNILVLLVTWPKAGRKSGLNLLVFHLIAVNLFMCFISLPLMVFMVSAKRARYFIAENACSYVYVIYFVGAGVINWAEASLAVNRCVALLLPHRYKTWTMKRYNISVVIFIWVMGSSTFLPRSFGVGGKMLITSLGTCVYLPKGTLGDFFTIFYYVPYGICGLGSFLILWKSYAISRDRVVGQEGVIFRRQVLRRLKMAKMILLTFLWTGVCLLPWGIVSVNFPSFVTKDPVSVLWMRICAVAQYGFTPCVLLLYNEEYRTQLKRIFPCGNDSQNYEKSGPNTGTNTIKTYALHPE